MRQFPAFFNLEGARIAVFGDGDEAARKLRLLVSSPAELVLVGGFAEAALAAEFEGRGEFRGLGWAEGFDFREDGGLEPREIAQGTVFAKKALADFEGVFALRAGVDEKREQFGIRQCLRPETQQALSRAVVAGDVLDSGHGADL